LTQKIKAWVSFHAFCVCHKGYLLSVGDQIHKNGDRPITYQLHRPESRIKEPTLAELQKEYKSLIDNMYYHFTHENFMNGFNMSRDKIGYLPWRREYKLEELGIN
jgi:hypothetical protein